MNNLETKDQSCSQEDKEDEDDEAYISKIAPDRRELRFDKTISRWRIKVFLKNKVSGISCAICGTPIEEGYNKFFEEQERTYFCPKYNTFMHKQCLICNHKTEDVCTMEDPEHSDYCVDVEFIIEKPNKQA